MAYLSSVPSLHPCELQALKLDGELSCFHTALDCRDGPIERARRILGAYENLIVLSSFSAAWAWGCAAEPGQHLVAYRRARAHVPEHTGLIVEQRTLWPTDIASCLTTPLRTACDLLKSDADDSKVISIVHTLMHHYGLTTEGIWEHINRNKTASHKRLITQRLSKVALKLPL